MPEFSFYFIDVFMNYEHITWIYRNWRIDHILTIRISQTHGMKSNISFKVFTIFCTQRHSIFLLFKIMMLFPLFSFFNNLRALSQLRDIFQKRNLIFEAKYHFLHYRLFLILFKRIIRYLWLNDKWQPNGFEVHIDCSPIRGTFVH